MNSVSPSDIALRLMPLPAIENLAEFWRGLEQPDHGSFFTTWNWIGAWLGTLPTGLDLQLLVAKKEDRAIGAAIVCSRRARRRWVINTRQLHLNSTGDPELDRITIEHNDFVGAEGLLPKLVQWFSVSAYAFDELFLPGLSDGDRSEGVGVLFRGHEQTAFTNRDLAAIAKEGIGSSLSRNSREQLNKSLREFSAFGQLSVKAAHTVQQALEYFDALKVLHIRSWSRRGRSHAFDNPYFEIFHRRLIETSVPKDAVQLLKISAGTHIVGYLYNFRHGKKTYAYQSGFSDDNSQLRPGYVCHALAMEKDGKEGIEEYDFLAGENRLKQSFAKTSYPMCWQSFARPSTLLRIEAVARAAFRL